VGSRWVKPLSQIAGHPACSGVAYKVDHADPEIPGQRAGVDRFVRVKGKFVFTKIVARSRSLLVLVVSAAVVAGVVVALPAAPADAAPTPTYSPALLINQSALEAPAQVNGSYYPGGMFAATDAERQAVETLEAQAVTNTIADHGLPAGDDSVIRSWARPDADANFWALIVQAVNDVHAAKASATEQSVNQWLIDSLHRQSILSTQDTGMEYTKWAGLGTAAYKNLLTSNASEVQLANFLSTTPNPYTGTGSATNPAGSTDGGYCTYQSPAPDQGDYTTNIFGEDAPSTCYVPCQSSIGCSPPVPAASQYATWGTADYENATVSSFGSANGLTATAQSASLIAAATTVGSGLVGAGTSALLAGTEVAKDFLRATQPYTLRTLQEAFDKAASNAAKFAEAPEEAVTAGEEVGETAEEATESVVAAADTVGLEVAASGIGAILTAIIFAITTAIEEGLQVFGAQQVPGQIANMIDAARTSIPDPYVVEQSDAGSLFALFINATLPEPSPGSCDNNFIISSEAALGTPCLNATPIPAPAISDPNWIISPVGGTATTNSTLTLQDASSGLTPGYRLHGNWVVTTATISGTTASTEGLSFHYSDWSGSPHTGWVYADHTPPSFVTVADTALGPNFDVDTCQQQGTCAVASSIDVVSPTGTDETVSLTPGVAAPDLPPANSCTVNGTCTPTTTTTSVTGPNVLAVGQSATYTAEIDADPSISGTADFVAGVATGCTGATLQPQPSQGIVVHGKIATCTITFDKAGTYFVFTTYNGSGGYLPSQGEITVNVGTGGGGSTGPTLPSTNTNVTASSGTVVGGQPVTFTATVDTGSSGVVPGGTVAFMAGNTTLCAAALLGETAPYTATCPYAFDVNTVATITATYSGDPGTKSSSGNVPITVNRASTKTTVSASPDSPAIGQPVTYTATVTTDAPGGGIPQGEVDFTGGASCSGFPVTQTPPFTASCTVTYHAGGPQEVKATYSGDLGRESSFGSTSVVVGTPATTTKGTPSAGPYWQGRPITDTAVVTSAAGMPTGTVSFSVCGPLALSTGCVPGGSSIGSPVNLNASGSATSALFTPSSGGLYCFRADYSGSTNFTTSSDGSSTQCVDVSVDSTKPTITATATPAANANGWNNSGVTVSFTCTDAGSGVNVAGSSLANQVLMASGKATGACVDNAGNSASVSYSAQLDTVAPKVTFAGNKGSYGILTPVAITCTATDALSGLASSTCAGATGLGWTFGAGAHPLSAQALDKAGNTGSASTTFTVTVKPADLATLTTQFVTGSAKYKSANSLTKLVVTALVSIPAKVVLGLAPTAKPAAKAQLLALYKSELARLVSSGYLTASQQSTLLGFAGVI
jgi:hypothetical protein